MVCQSCRGLRGPTGPDTGSRATPTCKTKMRVKRHRDSFSPKALKYQIQQQNFSAGRSDSMQVVETFDSSSSVSTGCRVQQEERGSLGGILVRRLNRLLIRTRTRRRSS